MAYGARLEIVGDKYEVDDEELNYHTPE